MRKGPGSVYDKWNIPVVICDTDIFHNGQPNHGGDGKIFEVMIIVSRGRLHSYPLLLII